jgi:hypothetical protein
MMLIQANIILILYFIWVQSCNLFWTNNNSYYFINQQGKNTKMNQIKNIVKV